MEDERLLLSGDPGGPASPPPEWKQLGVDVVRDPGALVADRPQRDAHAKPAGFNAVGPELPRLPLGGAHRRRGPACSTRA